MSVAGEEYDEHATYRLGSVFSTFSANPLHHPGLSFGGFLAETIPSTTEQIHRHLTSALSSALGHNAQLTYSLCDSNHVLQARLNANDHLRPSRNVRIMEVNGQPFNKPTSSRTFTPALDLYYHQDFRRHQTLTANVVASDITVKEATVRTSGSSAPNATSAMLLPNMSSCAMPLNRASMSPRWRSSAMSASSRDDRFRRGNRRTHCCFPQDFVLKKSSICK